MFNNWVRPKPAEIEHEYKVEYVMKGHANSTNDAFPKLADFVKAVKNAKIIELTPAIDSKIKNRSRTSDYNGLLRLIKCYKSYPQYRNENTLKAIYSGFENNKPMTLPMVLELPNGTKVILGGNTRTDIATHLGITPKALLIKTV